MKQKRTNKWLSLCLAAIASLLPCTSAWAQTPPLLTSGTCGTNVEWTFNESTKTLTISPKDGETNLRVSSYYSNYNSMTGETPAPWKNYYDELEGSLNNGPEGLIEHIVVEDGIVGLGDCAFYGLDNLKDVVLAPSVCNIGQQTFRYCPQLQSVVALYLGRISFIGDMEDELSFDNSGKFKLYAPQPFAEDIQSLMEENFYPGLHNLQVEGFQLKGDGYSVKTTKSTYDLLEVKNNSIQLQSTLKGENTATVNGKTYTYKSGTEVIGCGQDGIVKKGTDEEISVYEISETGKYTLNTSINNLFTKAARNHASTPLFTVTSSPTSGTGWAFDSKSNSLTISGDVQGEPWSAFKNIINYVLVKKGVTQLPNKAFCDEDYKSYIVNIIFQGANIKLNGSFMHEAEVYDPVQEEFVTKELIYNNIYVPSSALDAYKTAYADHLDDYCDFLPGDVTVTMPASGVMSFINTEFPCDFSDCTGLKAYIATEYNYLMNGLIMEPVTQVCSACPVMLKGKPGTKYTIPMGTWNSYPSNMLYVGYDAVDPSEDYYAYLKLVGTNFERFTTPEDLTDNIYVQVYEEYLDKRPDPSAPVGMLFADEEPVTAGILDGGARWTFDAATKTLTIDSDDGYSSIIYDYSKEYVNQDGNEEFPAPWRTYTKHDGTQHYGIEADIERVVVEDGIEEINDYVFYGLPNLLTVSLAPSVRDLYSGVFQGCPKLETVVLSSLFHGYLENKGEKCCTDGHGETFYVTNNQVAQLESDFYEFNVKVKGFPLNTTTGNGIKVEFYENPLTDLGEGKYTGDISMLCCNSTTLDGDATATVFGHTYRYDDESGIFNPEIFYLKDGSGTELEYEDVTEAGDYHVKANVKGLFTDAAKNTALSQSVATISFAPTTGEGWNYDRDSYTLTITGNVTDQPWKVFENDMRCVVVEEGVTRLPEGAFYEKNLSTVIIKGAGVDLNGSFLYFTSWDDGEDICSGQQLAQNIYVPSDAVNDYQTAYSEYLQENYHDFLPMDYYIDMQAESEGIMAFFSDIALDFSGCPELKAYKATDFDPATGVVTMTRVMKTDCWEGLILKGATGTYTAKIITYPSEAYNMLRPISYDYLAPVSSYDGVAYANFLLSGTGADRGFHPLTTGVEVEDNSAYLRMKKDDFDTWTASGKPISLAFDDEPDADGIDDIELADSDDDAWYTLNGTRLDGKPATKGIYLRNGKKVVVK